jgi:hypothetical protein
MGFPLFSLGDWRICGDKALLKTSGYRGIEVLTPRNFADRFLGE